LIALAGLFGGLLAGIGLAAGAEMNDESVRTENEAARIFGKPVLRLRSAYRFETRNGE